MTYALKSESFRKNLKLTLDKDSHKFYLSND